MLRIFTKPTPQGPNTHYKLQLDVNKGITSATRGRGCALAWVVAIYGQPKCGSCWHLQDQECRDGKSIKITTADNLNIRKNAYFATYCNLHQQSVNSLEIKRMQNIHLFITFMCLKNYEVDQFNPLYIYKKIAHIYLKYLNVFIGPRCPWGPIYGS